MDVFLEVVKMNIKILFQYKRTFFLSMAIFPLAQLVDMALFTSIYRYNGTDSIKGYSLSQMVWYFTTTYIVWNFVWNNTVGRLSRRILNGTLAMDLLRPMSLFRLELADMTARRVSGTLLELIPTLVLESIIFPPVFMTGGTLLRFFIIGGTAGMIYFLMNFLMGLLAFIVKNTSSLDDLKYLVILFLGGQMIPMEFFPDWVNRIADFTPFKYVMYWPIQFFLNREQTQDPMFLLRILLIQLAWCAGLYVLCKLCWRASVKKFCSVGG